MGSDRNVLGKTITLDRMPSTIIAVMPQGFDYPRGHDHTNLETSAGRRGKAEAS